MRKIIFALILLLPILLNAQVKKTLRKSIELNMPKTAEDEMPGLRGASVVWHPVQKKYYAAFAGNEGFPLAVFDIKGKLLSDENLYCMLDIRGLWYNTKLKKICGNGYSDIGWFKYKLDDFGIPIDYEFIAEGMNQPEDQSIGVFNPKSNKVYFFYGQEVYVYNADGYQSAIIRLYPGLSNAEEIDEDDDGSYLDEYYSSNVLIYTGIPKAEFGLLNVEEKQVELYNQKTGLMTQLLKLPSKTEMYPSFNFSYTNGIFWTFNQDTRKWTGYK